MLSCTYEWQAGAESYYRTLAQWFPKLISAFRDPIQSLGHNSVLFMIGHSVLHFTAH